MHRTTEIRPRGTAVGNERGIALLIVLIVVSLLTITVTEFTYSVQLDQHRTRNAIYALQAQLLARSGINLAEGYLMMDDQAQYDAYTEDWWVQLNEFCQGMQLEDSMRVRCRVRDESGKLNINNTRGQLRRTTAQAVTSDAILRDAMRCMFQHRNIPVDIVDRLADYWQQDTGDSTTQTQPTPQPGQTPTSGTQQVPEFTSLEDFASTFGIPSEQLHSLRTVLTAQPHALMPTININTATEEVLAAVLNAEKAPDCGSTDEVSQIMQRQADVDQVFHNTAEISSVISSNVDNSTQKRALFGVTSKLYQLEASALTNVDPTNPTTGGIGQTLSSLVYRYPDPRPRPGGPQAGPTGAPLPNWTLRPLDWQKEGGARLFRSAPTEETTPGSSDDEEGPNAGAPPHG
jgi:general secretion pathway protein K